MELIKKENSMYSKIHKGEISATEYNNYRAVKRGYKDFNDYMKNWYYKSKKHMPMSKNEKCSAYLGIYIAENILPKIFENVRKMPNGNKGYDFICKNGYKIDVKSSVLCLNNQWTFNINKNKIADYFLMLGFDNRQKLNVEHIWLIKNNEIINERKTNEFEALTITNNNKLMNKFRKYEILNKLNEVNEICDKFKELLEPPT